MTGMKKLSLAALAVAVLAYAAYHGRAGTSVPAEAASNETASDSILTNAFDRQVSNIQVEGQGTVVRILPDDNSGGRHQRFIVRIQAGQTVLIAHNIDLAARVSSLQEGDHVAFAGEYEWSAKGGVVHWTHRDPAGRHKGGWIRHDGQTFH